MWRECSRDDTEREVARSDRRPTSDDLLAEASRAGMRAPSGPASRAVAVALVVLGVVAFLALAVAFDGGAPDVGRRFRFVDPATADHLGLRIADPRSGSWVVTDHAHATGARALVSLAGEPGRGPGVALVAGDVLRDVVVVTRCKTAPDRRDRACGVVVRHHAGDHVVARLDAEQGTVELVAVVGGNERVLAAAAAVLGPEAWHELMVEARGDRWLVVVDGREALRATDRTVVAAGEVGLWAPSDCVAWFDELLFAPAGDAATPELLPFLRLGS